MMSSRLEKSFVTVLLPLLLLELFEIDFKQMLSDYQKGALLGQGTWGSVYEALRKRDTLKVAVKIIRNSIVDPLGGVGVDSNQGVNFTALRELKFLRYIKSPNILELLDVFISNGNLHLVLEFCPYDLGIECCHKHYVLHRDLKPANLLFALDGQLKIADFGLAKSYSSPEKMTHEVVTKWYRSPELLFGAPQYSTGVDIWAVGCIFAEIYFRTPFFPGTTDIDQLGKIFNVLGTPTTTNWSGVELLPLYMEFESRQPMNLLPLFRHSSSKVTSKDHNGPLELDLLHRMLTLDPTKRLTATQALQHPYFYIPPLSCQPSELPVPLYVQQKQIAAKRAAELNMTRLPSNDPLQELKKSKLI